MDAALADHPHVKQRKKKAAKVDLRTEEEKQNNEKLAVAQQKAGGDVSKLSDEEKRALFEKQVADPNSLIDLHDQMTFSEEMKAKARARRLGYNVPSQLDQGGGMPGIFGKFDLVIFILFGLLLWLYVKTEHRIDLASELWQRIKPAYDEGHWDDSSSTIGAGEEL